MKMRTWRGNGPLIRILPNDLLLHDTPGVGSLIQGSIHSLGSILVVSVVVTLSRE